MAKINALRTSEDILLATPRTVGVVGTTANNVFNTLTNPFTRGANFFHDWYTKTIERITSRKYDMKPYADILEGDKLAVRAKKRFGNMGTFFVNKRRQLGNIAVKGTGLVKSALRTVPLAWNMTVTNAGATLKDVGTTIGAVPHDIGNALTTINDQGPNKQQFKYNGVGRERLAWLNMKDNPTPFAPVEKPIVKEVKPEPTEDSDKKKA